MISDTSSAIAPLGIPHHQEYTDLVQRRTQISSRLESISLLSKLSIATAAAVPTALVNTTTKKKSQQGTKKSKVSSSSTNPSSSSLVLQPPTVLTKKSTDTHWDYLLKEMLWLSADFASERKRQTSMAKKQASAIQQYFATKKQREFKQLMDLELKRRKLASKISRDVVQKWWQGKIERVIAYKQKVDGEAIRKQYMDRQLMIVVKQTEKYSIALNQQLYHTEEQDDDGNNDDQKKRNNKKKKTATSIEEALQQSDQHQRVRNSSQRRTTTTTTTSVDYYTHLQEESTNPPFLYGESTEDEAEDEDWIPPLKGIEEDDPDMQEEEEEDESTFSEAERMDQLERRRWREWKRENTQEEDEDDEDDGQYSTCGTDPEEIQKLQEESTMEIDLVLQRLKRDAEEMRSLSHARIEDGVKQDALIQHSPFSMDKPMHMEEEETAGAFQEESEENTNTHVHESNIHYDESVQEEIEVEDGSEDYIEEDEDMMDNESTMEAEEKLGRDMTYDEELALLQRENEMSVDELRALYYGVKTKDSSVDVEEDGSGEYAEEEEGEMLADDESTMEAEEKLGRDMTYAEELDLLERENEMSVDELRALYYGVETKDLSMGGDYDDDGSEEYAGEQDENMVDDESTMEAEEKLGRDMTYDEELALLERENEMSVDELRALYYGTANADKSQNETSAEGDDRKCSHIPEYMPNDPIETFVDGGEQRNDHDVLSGHKVTNDSEEIDEEFTPNVGEDADDETTMEEEERLGRDMSYEEEIALLRDEGEMSIEELRAKYCSFSEEQGGNVGVTNNKRRFVTDDDSTASTDSSVTIRPKKQKIGAISTIDDGGNVLERLELSENRIRQCNVSRPFLLSRWVQLRPYQQIGLNWLVSMQTRRLNCLLADEMGLGKTLQTLCFLSYLACYKGIWGPHLVIVPTSCLVNWEMEIKRFTPAFKVLCYYGSAKRRRELRQGWKKQNMHHIVITSYQLAVQDSAVFKRKKWYYLILDEAQNIKNYESERWKVLVTFNSQRRLLLTGTPLQNNLMELWSLLHFLMPHVFRSRKEFSHWFSNPLNNIIEGNSSRNDEIISRLHGIIRPFVLRRLKKDVETELPGKFEHVIKCPMSRRQMFLYEEYMSRSSTRSALQKGGNYMGMMNVLMQLRKVCNHPDLFEPRSIITPLFTDTIVVTTADTVLQCITVDDPFLCLSGYLLHPLWSYTIDVRAEDRDCMSSANSILHMCLPSRNESIELLDNLIGSGKSQSMMNMSGLSKFLQSLSDQASLEKTEHIKFLSQVNFQRCQCSAPYSSTTLSAAHVNLLFSDTASEGVIDRTNIASTPKELLQMRRSLQQRADDIEELGKKIIFCIPKAGAHIPVLQSSKRSMALSDDKPACSFLTKTLNTYFSPFRRAHARLTSFFPDKRLVQFDAGKLQALAALLRDLKHGGHRCLIFTQMSKMLDILEAFLNLNGHTYLRLDGGTGVDKRQRLMDRFNVDKKMFCFILSTRSGGLGINLTGADTVVFYDSDWNAMDAQAQDRAHRIGQTREVHIYRLVSAHTVEENILLKAKQKRHLDYLVMEKGKFDVDELKHMDAHPLEGNESSDAFMTKEGLLDILGVDETDMKTTGKSRKVRNPVESVEQMEKAMELVEDEEDIMARCGAQKEMAEELREFDEAYQYKNDDDGVDSQASPEIENESSQLKPKEADLPKEENSLEELNALQVKYGLDKDSIEASLSPIERYAMKFRETVDPFYSIWYVSPSMMDNMSPDDQLDIDAIEAQKDEEEMRIIEEGDLLITNPLPDSLPRQRKIYHREKSRVNAEKIKRKLTGQSWETRIDALTKHTFWFNVDTGEAVWDKPRILNDLQNYQLAQELGWAALPHESLKALMEYLNPFPDRIACTRVCKQWRTAAQDVSLVKFVYPVESGALAMDVTHMEKNHYRSLSDALNNAVAGDVIELGDGHFWINESDIDISIPIKLVGDEDDPSNVIIEVNGTITWSSPFGRIEGVTLRRPKISLEAAHGKPILKIAARSKLDISKCMIDSHAILKEVANDSSIDMGFSEGTTVDSSMDIQTASIERLVNRAV